MTREERNTKLKNFITCLKCEVSGKECDDNCPVQYEAGNMGEIIENLEAISKALEQEPIAQERYEDLCEYFGNMKDILNSREDFKAWLDRVKWHIHKAEELYEKYEQEPCENAISRQAALGCCRNEWEEEVKIRLKSLPPVNPQPKTGHWIFDEILDKHYYCSECKSMGVDYWDYCPYCGAKMVEPQERIDKE